MAQLTPLARTLQLQFLNGTMADGRPKLRNRNWAHVRPDAADDDVLAVGQAIAALCADSLYSINRVDQTGMTAASSSGN
ncbi:MAG: DUF1659 domain-containing protein [Thermoflavifilum sp.]|nr:DUF1659 domain-containing protein [Thermoflavifilum sp.]MCL6513682.1 DUF1659 domain-containing protein [Alicyclobacillus sp.]